MGGSVPLDVLVRDVGCVENGGRNAGWLDVGCVDVDGIDGVTVDVSARLVGLE